jgi:hypothetical protein
VHNGDPTQSSTESLIAALLLLSDGIYSEDGVANAAIYEAAQRLIELDHKIASLELTIEDICCGHSVPLEER